MSESPAEVAPRGLSLEVVAAGAVFCASMSAVAATAFLRQEPPSLMLLAGWPLFALAGAVLLDRHPRSVVARVLVLLSLSSVLDILLALARTDHLTSAALVQAVQDLAGVHAVLLVAGVLWATRPPDRKPLAVAALLVALVGAALVLAEVPYAGWPLVGVGLVGLVSVLLVDVRRDERTERRRLTLLTATFAAGGLLVAAAALLASRQVAGYTFAATLILTVVLVTRLSLAEELRPLGDDVLDLLVGLGAVAVAALAAVLVWFGSSVVNLASPPTSAAFTAVVTFALAVPGAVWVRRLVLARRYGNGVISPADVAAITADLNARADPRDLLDRAARMVAAASGSREARIVLGEEEPEVLEGWVANELLVGGDRVGALLVDAGGPEGLESRQARVVSQLLPTVGLVTRAVGLAIGAEHARYDVTRERDAERARILGDLHDGLGPALAGMSMRVQAGIRSAPSPEHAALLADLADGLAASRTDLRRIVSGLTPSALDDEDLDGALRTLVTSFRGPHDGPSLSLTTSLSGPLDKEVQVAVYRCVAEGLTNALRHASASSISVTVARTGSCVSVDVVDDGAGGAVVPGVGLSSLAARAEAGGGHLVVRRAQPTGTRLHLELPVGSTP
ncbi:MAG TPA: histidine kinase [Nocardioides sp.]|nr:histidine kinase [Nocardioides sp.]